jgi:hypothetical protein
MVIAIRDNNIAICDVVKAGMKIGGQHPLDVRFDRTQSGRFSYRRFALGSSESAVFSAGVGGGMGVLLLQVRVGRIYAHYIQGSGNHTR